jgi:hypothetical protein
MLFAKSIPNPALSVSLFIRTHRLMKNARQQGFVKGHNFSCANKIPEGAGGFNPLKKEPIQAAFRPGLSKGTGFSPYINPAKSTWL